MTNEIKNELFEKTYDLELQVKRLRVQFPESDIVRSEVERRYHHNLDRIAMSVLLGEYEEYAKSRILPDNELGIDEEVKK